MGRLVSEMYGNNLVDRDIGSAVRTFRKNESFKSKFPNSSGNRSIWNLETTLLQ